jgi:hypothetical protein
VRNGVAWELTPTNNSIELTTPGVYRLVSTGVAPGATVQVTYYEENDPGRVRVERLARDSIMAAAVILGLGTMAYQNANAVAIIGGSAVGLSSLGVGTTNVNGATVRLLSGQGATPTANENTSVLSLVSTTAAAVGVGPNLRFVGESGNGVTPYTFAILQGQKDSAVAGNYSGALSVRLADAAGAIVEPAKFAVGLISLKYPTTVTGLLTVNDSASAAGSNNFVVQNTQAGASQAALMSLTSDLARQMQIGYTSSTYTALPNILAVNCGFMYNSQGGGLSLISGGNVRMSMDLTNMHHEFTSTAHRIYNTTSLVNFERAIIRWNANQLQIGTDQGGTGTARDLNIVTVGAASIFLSTSFTGRWQLDASGMLFPFATNAYDFGKTGTNYIRNMFVAGYYEGTEIADPAAPSANAGRLYFRDNGGGKTQLVVRFNTGAIQVIATEP